MSGIGYMTGAESASQATARTTEANVAKGNAATSTGDYDISKVVRFLNLIYVKREGDKLVKRPVPIAAAGVIALEAKKAADKALEVRPAGAFIPEQDTARKNVQGKMRWHVDKIKELTAAAIKEKGLKDKEAVNKWASTTAYDHADDLRKWAEASFVEYNAARAGAQYVKENLSYWREVGDQFVRVAKALDEGVEQATTSMVKYGLIAVGIGIAGFLGYKYLESRKASPQRKALTA